MLKKALLAGVLGVFLATGAAFAGHSGGGCSGDQCNISHPYQLNFGLDFNIDVDVCVDAGNLIGCHGDDCWSTQAVIYQEGEGNSAGISQVATNDLAGIIQVGDSNTATTTQNAANDYAFTVQGGSSNTATITQNLESASAIAIQLGTGNTATINQ